jgi:6-phosphogluconolactonase (cycloisomerase 2 family)
LGKYLYVADEVVTGFSIDQNTGALTPVPGSPFQTVGPASCPTCAGPTFAFNLAIDPAGAHLYTADSWAGSVDAFNIDSSTGSLTHMQGAPFVDRMPTGQSMDPAFNPYGIAVDGRNKFLYGYDSGDEDISIFPINSSTGALGTVQKTSNTFGGVCAGQLIRADATGKFLYGLGSELSSCVGSVSVIGFSINQTNGTLTPIPKGFSGSETAVQSVPFKDGIALVP